MKTELITAKKLQIKTNNLKGYHRYLFFYSTTKNNVIYKPLVSLEFIAHSNLGITEVF